MVTEPIRDRKKLKAMADFWLDKWHFRNYLLIILGVCFALRISDLLRLTWADVYNEESGVPLTHIVIREGKTGKNKTIELNSKAIRALKLSYRERQGDFLFTSSRKGKSGGERAIGRHQARRVIQKAADEAKVIGRIACHSLRKTFGYHAWKNGTNPVVLMEIFNHSSYEVTKRYLGITQDDTNDVYAKLNLF